MRKNVRKDMRCVWEVLKVSREGRDQTFDPAFAHLEFSTFSCNSPESLHFHTLVFSLKNRQGPLFCGCREDFPLLSLYLTASWVTILLVSIWMSNCCLTSCKTHVTHWVPLKTSKWTNYILSVTRSRLKASGLHYFIVSLFFNN